MIARYELHSFSQEGNQAEAQGPPVTPTLIDLNGPLATLAQAAAQAPAQSHHLAPGYDHHMSQEAIEEANRRFMEEDERLAEINKQRAALDTHELSNRWDKNWITPLLKVDWYAPVS